MHSSLFGQDSLLSTVMTQVRTTNITNNASWVIEILRNVFDEQKVCSTDKNRIPLQRRPNWTIEKSTQLE